MSLEFHLQKTNGAARAGRLITPHGEVETPVFMPVGTLASVKGVPQDVLEELGVQILLGNTYHLYLRPGVEQVRKLGGLHRFMAWSRAILTDSGGFQVFSLSELRKISEEGVKFRSHLDGSSHFFSPESAMAAQIGLGADIIMAFDECTEHPAERERVRDSMELTLRWAARSKKYFEEHQHEVPWKTAHVEAGALTRRAERSSAISASSIQTSENRTGTKLTSVAGSVETQIPRVVRNDNGPNDKQEQVELRSTGQPRTAVPTWTEQAEAVVPLRAGVTQALFGIVQGGMHPELRRESAERTVEIGFPGYAIGGLSVGEPRSVTREIVEATLQHLPADKPRYLMGVGTPDEIVEYANLGVDLMDCVLPTRAARHGLLFTSAGKVSIKQARYAGDEAPLDANCGCRVCTRYSRAYLRHLYASNEVLAQVLNTVHNLSFYLDTMRGVRHSIALGESARSLSGVRSAPKP